VIDSEQRRRAIRQFVRDHHPDRGGDPETFAEGLRRLREGRPVVAGHVIEAHRSKSPIASLSRCYQHWQHRRHRQHRERRLRRVQHSGRVQ
jgi:hypothetical protein